MGTALSRASSLVVAALVAGASLLPAGCAVDEVTLEGKACPCADGWVCDTESLVCVRPMLAGDGGTMRDSGTVPRDTGGWDAGGLDAGGRDAGERDAGGGDDAGGDAGRDAGPADGGTPRTATVQIARSIDDAEECLDGTSDSDGPGSMYIGSTDIELVYDPTGSYCVGLQLVGFRFDVVPIPRRATITEAYLELVVNEVHSDPTNLVLSAEAANDAASFGTTRNDLSSRAVGSARVGWSGIPVWDTVGDRVRSPDLSPLIREVTGRAGWTLGNALVIVIEGSGRRVVESWDGQPAEAARLTVSWVE